MTSNLRPMKVLVLEDEDDWARKIRSVVEKLSWNCEHHSDLDSALNYLLSNTVDIVVLDRNIGSHGDEGLSLLGKLQKLEMTPMMLVVSQIATTGERVRGLEAGADDYLPKPFEDIELRARLVALARRGGNWSNYSTVILLGDLEIRKAARTITYKGKSRTMPVKPFDLLVLLAENRGEVVSREMIWREVWKEYSGLDVQNNTIDVAIKRVRDALDEFCGDHQIESVRKRGYRWKDAA